MRLYGAISERGQYCDDCRLRFKISYASATDSTFLFEAMGGGPSWRTMDDRPVAIHPEYILFHEPVFCQKILSREYFH